MTKEELICKLHALGIDSKLVHFSSGAEEGYYISSSSGVRSFFVLRFFPAVLTISAIMGR